jgi:hypothetical protein
MRRGREITKEDGRGGKGLAGMEEICFAFMPAGSLSMLASRRRKR